MNISDLDCPQYVRFENLHDASEISVDSLESAEQSEDYDPEDSVSGDVSTLPSKSSCVSAQDATLHETGDSNYLEISTANDLIEGDLSGYSDLKENYPVQFVKNLPVKVNPALPKNTVPKPFRFQTDTRLKNKEKDSGDYEKKDFVSELRQNIVLQPTANRITKVKPFNLTEPKKRKHDGDYHPLAEQVVAFQKKTPERYHSSSQKGFQPQEHWQPTHVIPKSPKLHAVKRRRMVAAQSRDQEEEKEVADMKAHEFHAKPVDPKIFNEPFKIKRQSKVPTKAKNFDLKTAQRSNAGMHGRKKSEKKYKFKARPVPKAILSGTTGLKEKPVIPVTAPKSPDFEVDHRLEKRKEHELEKEKAQQELERIQRKQAAKPKQPEPLCVPYTKKRTEIKPFSFDQKDKERLYQKEKKIQEELENECKPYIFHAKPIPFPEPDVLPVVPKKQTTEAVPFKFLLEDRALKSSHSSEESFVFKALPATVLKREPFVPEKAPKPNIEIQEFNLYTDKRASERQHLKELKDREEQEKQQMFLEQKEKEEELERLELLKLRREIVHKANPIRQYKPVEIKSSSIPLTEPKSPDFETDKRLKSRHYV